MYECFYVCCAMDIPKKLFSYAFSSIFPKCLKVNMKFWIENCSALNLIPWIIQMRSIQNRLFFCKLQFFLKQLKWGRIVMKISTQIQVFITISCSFFKFDFRNAYFNFFPQTKKELTSSISKIFIKFSSVIAKMHHMH